MNLPEPDTHCFDDDTQKDVWSYSKELVEQMLAQAYEAGRKAEQALWMLTTISQEIDEIAKEKANDQAA